MSSGAPACGPGTKSLFKKSVGCGTLSGSTVNYCCPNGNVLSDCVWRGDPPDCADALCAKGEITMAQNCAGDHDSTCLCKFSPPAMTDASLTLPREP